jgi:ParB family chromosome partitioning protein
MSRRGGLGRGLGALIPTSVTDDDIDARTEEDVAAEEEMESEGGPIDPPIVVATPPEVTDAMLATGAVLIEIDPRAIDPNPRQPREVFDDEEIDGLAVSLRDVGMLQPLVVRPQPGSPSRYELIAGERRWRAAQRAGMNAVPAIVRTTEDADLLKVALLENIHRVQLNPLEEAAAYQQLLDDFGVTQDELATRLGRSRPTISNLLRLLNLPVGVQRRLAAGVLSAGHAKALLALPDAGAQETLADRIVAEGISVRGTEELVRMRLVDEPTRTRKGGTDKRRMTAPGLIDLQDDLSDALLTRVRISMGARRGRLTIEFVSVDDLERIVGIIADGLGAAGTSPVRGRSDGATTVSSAARRGDALGDLPALDDLDDLDELEDLDDLDD